MCGNCEAVVEFFGENASKSVEECSGMIAEIVARSMITGWNKALNWLSAEIDSIVFDPITPDGARLMTLSIFSSVLSEELDKVKDDPDHDAVAAVHQRLGGEEGASAIEAIVHFERARMAEEGGA